MLFVVCDLILVISLLVVEVDGIVVGYLNFVFF